MLAPTNAVATLWQLAQLAPDTAAWCITPLLNALPMVNTPLVWQASQVPAAGMWLSAPAALVVLRMPPCDMGVTVTGRPVAVILPAMTKLRESLPAAWQVVHWPSVPTCEVDRAMFPGTKAAGSWQLAQAWAAVTGRCPAGTARLAVRKDAVVWQASQDSVVARWLGVLPLANTPLWQVPQVPVATSEWGKCAP